MTSMSALAQDAVVFTGLELGKDYRYAYFGSVLPALGSKSGQGFVQRYLFDYITYSYEQTPIQDIDAKVTGVEAALGYQGTHDNGSWGVYLGARYTQTRLSPNDPGNDDLGSQVRAKFQIEGDQALAPDWRISGMASYVLVDNNYWVRLRAQKTLSNGLVAGPELVVQGDSNYRAAKLGAFLGGIKMGAESRLTFRVGASKAENSSVAAYLGLDAYFLF